MADVTSLTASAQAVQDADPERRKLEKAAQDFEGLLLNSLWKSMTEGMKGSLDDSDSTNSTFREMGMQAISGAMAAAGGLGIGRMLLKALEKQQHAEGQQPAATAGIIEGGRLADRSADGAGQKLPPGSS